MLQLQLSTATPASIRSTGAGASAIILSANTIAENAALGAAVGTLSTIGTTGTAAFTLVDSAGSRFALSGANVQRGATALDYEAATSHNIIVSVSGVTPTISNATLAISVTNVAEVPVNSVAPTLSPTSGVVGTLITCGQGTWSNTPTSYAYQWMKGGVDISGETSSTYTSVLADDLTTLTCKVLASNADGPGAGYVTTSNSHSVGAVALLLDSYSKGIVFSMRRLNSSYSGNCVRIRRSSDNAEQDFGFVSNVVDTAGIATFVGGGTGFIVTFYDQSGNSFDVTQATAGSQPTYVAASMNGKPVIRWNGTSTRLLKTSVPATSVGGTDQVTIMYIEKPDGTDDAYQVAFYGVGAEYIALYSANADILTFFYGDLGAGALGTATLAGWDDVSHVVELYRQTDGTQVVMVDGVSKASGTKSTGLTTGSSSFDLCAGQNMYVKGDVPEFFVLKTDIGSTARNTIRADMGAYYGITVA